MKTVVYTNLLHTENGHNILDLTFQNVQQDPEFVLFNTNVCDALEV